MMNYLYCDTCNKLKGIMQKQYLPNKFKCLDCIIKEEDQNKKLDRLDITVNAKGEIDINKQVMRRGFFSVPADKIDTFEQWKAKQKK